MSSRCWNCGRDLNINEHSECAVCSRIESAGFDRGLLRAARKLAAMAGRMLHSDPENQRNLKQCYISCPKCTLIKAAKAIRKEVS